MVVRTKMAGVHSPSEGNFPCVLFQFELFSARYSDWPNQCQCSVKSQSVSVLLIKTQYKYQSAVGVKNVNEIDIVCPVIEPNLASMLCQNFRVKVVL